MTYLGRAFNSNTVTHFLKRNGFKLNLPNKYPDTFSTHMLRHSHVSMLAEKGVPLKAIMEVVGHKDAKTTLQIYTHVTEDTRREVADKIDEIDFII